VVARRGLSEPLCGDSGTAGVGSSTVLLTSRSNVPCMLRDGERGRDLLPGELGVEVRGEMTGECATVLDTVEIRRYGT
jgi:hypothetical protein